MSQGGAKLLKIDDKSLVSDLEKAGYRKMGILVQTVHSEREALSVLEKEDYHVLMINLDYPKIDALAFCRKLKRDPRWTDLQVIITSVNAKVRNQQEALNAGASLFIEQPFPRPFLVEKIKKLLELQTRNEQRITGDATLVLKVNGREKACQLADLSNSGILVYLKDALPLGQAVSVEIKIPQVKKILNITGEVVRQVDSSKLQQINGEDTSNGIGMGIKFITMSAHDRSELEKYVHLNNSNDLNMVYYL